MLLYVISRGKPNVFNWGVPNDYLTHFSQSFISPFILNPPHVGQNEKKNDRKYNENTTKLQEFNEFWIRKAEVYTTSSKNARFSTLSSCQS